MAGTKQNISTPGRERESQGSAWCCMCSIVKQDLQAQRGYLLITLTKSILMGSVNIQSRCFNISGHTKSFRYSLTN